MSEIVLPQSSPLPLISVIIPVYNGERFLAEAIESVLQQNDTPLEIIVVDDGSTDGTVQIAARFGKQVHYLYQLNQGPAAARNRGLAIARGEWIAFLDSDDRWASGRLHRQLELAHTYPAAAMIWGMLQVIRQPEQASMPIQDVGKPTLQTQLGSALIRRALFELTEVGTLDEALYTNDDVDWFCRLFERRSEIVIHQDVVTYYRWHQTNLVANQTGDQGKAVYGLLHALARSLQRRRQQGNGTPPALPTNIRMVSKAVNKTLSKAMGAEVEGSLSW